MGAFWGVLYFCYSVSETCHSKCLGRDFGLCCLCVFTMRSKLHTLMVSSFFPGKLVFCKSYSTFSHHSLPGRSLSSWVSGKHPNTVTFAFKCQNSPQKTSQHNILTLTVSVECRLSLCMCAQRPLSTVVYLPTLRLIITHTHYNTALKACQVAKHRPCYLWRTVQNRKKLEMTQILLSIKG